jgi:sugar-specific transcriptional regulator TrmB
MPIVTQKIMDALKSIGLNLYERNIWVALLSRGSATVGELADIANVPRSRAYDILESLSNKGFVVLQPSKPLKAVALPPEEALERVKKRLEEKFKETISRIDDLKTSPLMKELKEIYQRGMKSISPEEIIGALKGKELVFQRLEYMFKVASKNISILMTPEGLKDLTANHLEALKKAKEKGVEIRIVVPFSDEIKDEVKTLSGLAEIRCINEKEIPVRGNFTIVDNKEVVMGLVNPKEEKTEEIAFWTKSQHAASNVLAPMFNLIWEKSKPI